MDLFSTNSLTAVVNSPMNDRPAFLLDRYFGTVETHDTEEIHFDIEPTAMGLAPFVLPVVEGQLMSNLGFETATFKPAYIKPKRAFDNSTVLKRSAGEALTGSISPDERLRRNIATHLQIDRQMIRRRLEWMAASILRTGAVTITGEKYPTKVVSFGRDAALTVALVGAAKWDQAGVNPLTDLGTWAALVGDKGETFPADVIMDSGAWNLFRNHAEIVEKIQLTQLPGQPDLNTAPVGTFNGFQAGTIDNFRIWVYFGSYKDSSGTVTRFLPNGTVLMVGDMMGSQAYGAIYDEEAGFQALPLFSKSWTVPDPSRRFIMTQSAPLLVPRRVNATFAATVL